MKPGRRLWAVLAASGLVLLLTGCETWITGGTKIQPQTVATLEPGLAYADVVAELGPPLIQEAGGRVIAYPWDTKSGNYPANPLAAIFDGLTYANVDVNEKEFHLRYHALALKFDGQQKLLAWQVLKATNTTARLEAIRDWAAR